MLKMKKGYSRSLRGGVLHFAAHSHHPRPDVTREATLACWDDAAQMLDSKWNHVFGKILPQAQKNVAELLDIGRGLEKNIAFAPNATEFVARILSSFDPQKPLRILTTSNEFQNAMRLFKRLAERPNVKIDIVGDTPHEDFAARFMYEASANEPYDLVFFSHVFFDTGYRLRQCELDAIVPVVRAKSQNTVIVIDGYHGFCAVPTSLRNISDHVFYMAGGYKYAQCGEDACFLYVPPNCTLRPEYTGWFAEFGKVSMKSLHTHNIEYPDNAFRFWGSTFNPVGLYCANAVCDWMKANELTVQKIRDHVVFLQRRFLEIMAEHADLDCVFNERNLASPKEADIRGNFLTYDCADTVLAAYVKKYLENHGIITDHRRWHLRVGFGIYHDEADVHKLAEVAVRTKMPGYEDLNVETR